MGGLSQIIAIPDSSQVVHRCQAACDSSLNWAPAGRERVVEVLTGKQAGHPCCVCVCVVVVRAWEEEGPRGAPQS